MSLSAKRSYKFIAIFLCFCLIVCMMPRPDAHAIAGIDDVVVGAGICMFLAALLGYTADNHGDFKAACTECWNQTSSNMKDAILSNVTMSGGALEVGALVAAAEFHNIWNHVIDFFSSEDGVIEIPSSTNLRNLFTQTQIDNPTTCISSSSGYVCSPLSRGTPIPFGTNVSFVNIKGETVNITTSLINGSYRLNMTIGNSFSAQDVSMGGTVDKVYTLCLAKYINEYTHAISYHILPCNPTTGRVFANVEPTNVWRNSCEVANFDFPADQEIPVSSVPIIPIDAVYDALVEKSTSADGISLSEDSPTFIEIFGDIADDVALIADQVQALTDTGVLEAVDEAYYTDPADVTVPRLPFLPGDFSGFGSIWHYVEEWLASIGGFISLILNVWSSLPYIIVVPVYASVVLILIFGVYRKFIA